ncbi:MAG: zinc ribbon domain-containing protein [Planctomycetota bacterium]
MPTYEYVCDACGHEFEEFQSMSAKPLRKCPACGKVKLRRLIGTGAGVIFKGSGFYETDYRSEGYKKAEKAEKDAGKPKKDEGKSSGDGGKKADSGSSSSSSESKSSTKTDSGGSSSSGKGGGGKSSGGKAKS